MLFGIFNRLLRRDNSSRVRDLDLQRIKAEANDLRAMGKLHEAIELYRECIEIDRFDVDVLNALGACLDDIGDDEAAREHFELVYSLDDTYIAGVVNYAKKLADKKESARALELLKYVGVCEPEYPHVFSIYASVCFAKGDAVRAAEYQLKGWLGSFDSLRAANSYLFTLAYSGAEQRLASEHKFWAETLRTVNLDGDFATSQIEAGESVTTVKPLPSPPGADRKIRIGYWSPDLRGHSVAYFFRPLLDYQDKSKYEIFVYHDSFRSDEVTEAIKRSCDHFHDVYLLNDVELYELMRSHQLDILVEMAGHTSANRLMLFKDNRFATLQISGIGYPPTTGLKAMDAKLLDCHIANSSDAEYYSEEPMILPSSFWCFDPMEAQGVDIKSTLPYERNGYVTYACVGNISKISKDLMACWVRIMSAEPSSRLLIRSISFEDAVSKDAMAAQMLEAGIDMTRVDMRVAVGGPAFYESYNDIDIILDTYPFNGGTTTCFAAYMGVPVVTRAGESLISRMGLSIMTNMGAADWVANDAESYVANAVRAAHDVKFLRDFRANARTRFKSSALGNGAIFAADFERACMSFLERKREQEKSYVSAIPALPADELMRRTYAVWRSGNGDAAARVLRHCLDHYPNHGGAHLFVAMQIAVKEDFSGAIDYLVSRIDTFDPVDQVAAMISIIRWCLLSNDHVQANMWLEKALARKPGDRFDAMQLRLYQASLSTDQRAPAAFPVVSKGQKLVVLIPCDDDDYFQAMEMRMRCLCRVPEGCVVSYVRCSQQTRIQQYEKWLKSNELDVLIIMQRVVEVVNPNFYIDILSALNACDVVGVAGSSRWTRSNWRGDQFEVKTAGFLTESNEVVGQLELHCLGVSDGVLVGAQAVLDGVMLALRPLSTFPEFESDLTNLNWTLEEDWSYELCKAGLRLAVHRNLGALIHETQPQDRRLGYPGLLRLQEKHNFPLFAGDRDDGMVLSVPVADAAAGLSVMRRFCEPETLRV